MRRQPCGDAGGVLYKYLFTRASQAKAGNDPDQSAPPGYNEWSQKGLRGNKLLNKKASSFTNSSASLLLIGLHFISTRLGNNFNPLCSKNCLKSSELNSVLRTKSLIKSLRVIFYGGIIILLRRKKNYFIIFINLYRNIEKKIYIYLRNIYFVKFELYKKLEKWTIQFFNI